MSSASVYPDSARERDRWILSRRPARNQVDPQRPYAAVLERERAESGVIASVATIFLTNRECPWRCLMCDLWKNTLTESVPPGAIPAQIDWALRELGVSATSTQAGSASAPRQLKLYNSGSFFDPRAIPPSDHPAIAERARGFERIIVECHPSLVDESAIAFRDRINGKLEVALGLETAHPAVLEKLNKRLTCDQFAHAADYLGQHDIALRVFLLVKPPFLEDGEVLPWTRRSIDFAFECGASVVSLIPTRAGNGAMDALAAHGEFAPPSLEMLEETAAYGIGLRRGRVFADLWDLETFSRCQACFPARKERLERMNLQQGVEPAVSCPVCQEHSHER